MPLRILIVEDEDLIALDLRELLQEAGHTVLGQAATAQDAVRLATKLKPDVVLMDVDLRGSSNGFDAAEELEAKSPMPVLFLTSRSDFLVRAMSLNIEPLGYITKPYSGAEVLEALEAVGRPSASPSLSAGISAAPTQQT